MREGRGVRRQKTEVRIQNSGVRIQEVKKVKQIEKIEEVISTALGNSESIWFHQYGLSKTDLQF